MAQVELNLEGLTIPEKIAKAKQIVKAITPTPPVPDLQSRLAEYGSRR